MVFKEKAVIRVVSRDLKDGRLERIAIIIFDFNNNNNKIANNL